MAVARHRILDELRRRTVEQRVFAAESVDQLVSQIADSSPALEDDAVRHDEGNALQRALAELPPSSDARSSSPTSPA